MCVLMMMMMVRGGGVRSTRRSTLHDKTRQGAKKKLTQRRHDPPNDNSLAEYVPNLTQSKTVPKPPGSKANVRLFQVRAVSYCVQCNPVRQAIQAIQSGRQAGSRCLWVHAYGGGCKG
jgi:hypothetical protein